MTDETTTASVPKAEKPFESPVTLQPDETVLRVLRRHWIHLIQRIAYPLGYMLGGLLLVWLLSFTGIGAILWLVWGVLFIYCLVWIGLRYYTHRNDMWIVTNQRLIDSSKPTPIKHIVASADLINVEDIRVNKNGLLQTSLNYGDLICQTAGVKENFILKGIHDPTEVLALIDRTRDEARRRVVSQQGGTTVKGVAS